MLNYRGFEKRQALFLGFPIDVYWRRVELEPHELGRLKYMREQHWDSFSKETRRPVRVLERIVSGELSDDPGRHVMAIQQRVKEGGRFPELIAAEGPGDDLILIEGLCRATAYVGVEWQENIPIFLASSPTMDRWCRY
jgi:hypothetical protein